MNLTHLSLALAVSVAALAPTSAHADTAGDRVLLVAGGVSGCPGAQASFHRVHQSPDGYENPESTEFQVPAGKYLEITSIEYTLPGGMRSATSYVQYLDLFLRQRSGTRYTNLFAVTYSNSPLFHENADYSFTELNDFTSPGVDTHVGTFPAGPLVSNQARLCLSTPASYGTTQRYKIRGRLIPADPTAVPPGGGSALP
jgi:hypothetical protein